MEIEMKIRGLMMDPVTNMPIVILKDLNGNTVTFQYLADGSLLYVDTIRYTGNTHTGAAGQDKVKFEYDTRTDTRVMYNKGFRQERNKRLKRVSTFAGTQLVRRYLFSYDLSPATGRSLLKTIALTGNDDTSTGVSASPDAKDSATLADAADFGDPGTTSGLYALAHADLFNLLVIPHDELGDNAKAQEIYKSITEREDKDHDVFMQKEEKKK